MATVVNFLAEAPNAHWAKVTVSAWGCVRGELRPPRHPAGVATVCRVLDRPYRPRAVGGHNQVGREPGQRVVLHEVAGPASGCRGHPLRLLARAQLGDVGH
eukprot:6174453-Pleurochrysis_carterae.AAC.1